MRKLMWFTVGFGIAAGAYAYFHMALCLLLPVVISGSGVLGFWLLSRWKRKLRIGTAIFVGMFAGFLWISLFQSFYIKPVENLNAQTKNLDITARDYSQRTKIGCVLDGEVRIENRTYKIRTYLNQNRLLVPGDKIRGSFQLKSTLEEKYNPGKGIFLRAYQRGKLTYINSEFLALRDIPTYLRECLEDQIIRIFPGDTENFAKALFLGIDEGLDYETNTALKISGIRHVIAVSGLHITVLWTLIYFALGKNRFLTMVIGVPLLLLFAAVTGFSPSVTRACVVQILMLTATLVNRERDPLTALAFAALLMLLLNPFSITSISFQLSFGCVIGILSFSERIYNWLMDPKHLGRWNHKNWRVKLLKSSALSVSVSVGASLLTTPLCAVYFRTVSLAGPITNLLVLWLVPIIFYGIIFSCLIGLVWSGAGMAAAGVISWGIRYILWIAAEISRFPLAAVYTTSPYIIGWLILSGILIAFYLLYRRKYPFVLLGSIATGLCTALLLSWLTPLTGECRLTVLNVGQGQCVLFQSDGKTFMVDCGGSYDEHTADLAAETLLSQGITTVDGALLTHYDRDHIGALAPFLTRISCDRIMLPPYDPGSQDQSKFIAALKKHNMSVIRKNVNIHYGNTKISVFASNLREPSNESGLCVLFQTKNCDILITGDRGFLGEYMLMQQTSLPDLEVLVVGHHGSKFSTCEELLIQTSPDTAIISAGKNNHYGHPSPAVLERLAKHRCKVYRTDLDGTIVYKG